MDRLRYVTLIVEVSFLTQALSVLSKPISKNFCKDHLVLIDATVFLHEETTVRGGNGICRVELDAGFSFHF
jgi:hypothetical protein